MDDLGFGLEEELELDYDAEEARKAKEIADKQSKSLDEEEEVEGGNGGSSPEAEQSDLLSNTELKSASRKRKSSPPKWNRGIINDDDEVEPGRDIIRATKSFKRFRYQPDLLPAIFFPDEKDPDEPLSEEVDEHPALTKADVEELFDSLEVDVDDEDVPLNTVYVHGAKDMTHYQIEKVFAEYNPHIVLFVEDSSCIVQFRQSRIAAKMLVGMTKKLKRIRKAKKIEEEGEIMDSEGEEEEGQTKKDEDGEAVQIVSKDVNVDVTDAEKTEIEIDVKKFKVPKGKWRVVSKHIPSSKVLIVRYAKQSEIQKASKNPANTEYRTERANYISNGKRAKCGINVFDSTGKELPWNFEHDTRIFEDPALKGLEVSYEVHKKSLKEAGAEKPHEENIQLGERTIRSRGRGTKMALQLRFSSSSEEESDEEEKEEDGWMKDPVAMDAVDDSILDSPVQSPAATASDSFKNQVLGSK